MAWGGKGARGWHGEVRGLGGGKGARGGMGR